MKTKKTLYNSIAGIIYYVSTVLLGIINRKFVIAILGIEYQGVNGLFSNILSMLSIAELGIGLAIVYHLYKPLNENNISEIKSLMHFYKKSYQIIAGIIFVLGLTIIPFLNYIVGEHTLAYSLSYIYIWFLADTVVSYLFTYKRSILIADQKNYIVIICDFIYQFSNKIAQIFVLLASHNFIYYLVTMVVCRVGENILINYISNKHYPYLKEKVEESLSPIIFADIKLKVKGTIFHKIGSFIVLGTDNILISKFLGLAVVGICSNYLLIINSIKSICYQIITAATASVGHMLAEKNTEKNFQVYSELQILNAGLLNCAVAGIFCVATPMISLIFGSQYTISEFTLFILSLNTYIQGMRTVYTIFKETAGVLYEDRFVPLLESIANIVASLILLYFWGLPGIFMGTIISSMILFTYTYPIFVYCQILKHKISEYYFELLWLLGITLLSMLISKFICSKIIFKTLMLQISFNIAITLIISNIIYILGYAVWNKQSQSLLKRIKMFLP